MFCDTTIFCIAPGAGIGGIGNGFIVAPAQYALKALPKFLINGDNGGIAPFDCETFYECYNY